MAMQLNTDLETVTIQLSYLGKTVLTEKAGCSCIWCFLSF